MPTAPAVRLAQFPIRSRSLHSKVCQLQCSTRV